ncbi:MAG: nitroreductase family protein [Halanaerobium sp.]|nr:nitroreductase family protein [Halanaerobium sp.]
MQTPLERWYSAIFIRSSRRKFTGQRLSPARFRELKSFSEKLNQMLAGVRIVLVEDGCQGILRGVVGSYGIISGSRSYAAIVGDTGLENVAEKAGYLGEAFILEATSRGLATCWIGGFFNAEAVQDMLEIEEQERIYAVTPVGTSPERLSVKEHIIKGLSSARKRKELTQLCLDDYDDNWADWIKSALECARLAPSAVNRQPWRFQVKDDQEIIVSHVKSKFTGSVSPRLDCGISMLHLEVGAAHAGATGNWQYLKSPKVARFRKEVSGDG